MSDVPESGSNHDPSIPQPAAGATPPPYVPASPTPPPYIPPTSAAGPSTPNPAPTPPVTKLGGLSIAALVVGGIAFLSGWVPFFGAVLGLVGGVLGVFAILRGQSKPISIISIVLSGLALLTSIGVTVAVVIGAATGTTSTSPIAPSVVAPSPTAVEPTLTEPSPSPTPTAAVVVDNSAFAAEAHSHIVDINKDLDDMVERTVNSQMFRLLGNTIELSFNLAQLRVLDVPEAIATDWSPALDQLEASISATTEAATDYSADLISADQMLAAIESTRAQAAVVDAIVSRVE